MPLDIPLPPPGAPVSPPQVRRLAQAYAEQLAAFVSNDDVAQILAFAERYAVDHPALVRGLVARASGPTLDRVLRHVARLAPETLASASDGLSPSQARSVRETLLADFADAPHPALRSFAGRLAGLRAIPPGPPRARRR